MFVFVIEFSNELNEEQSVDNVAYESYETAEQHLFKYGYEKKINWNNRPFYEKKGAPYANILKLNFIKNEKQTELIKVCLHKKNAHTLTRTIKGDWFLDNKEISEEEAVNELAEAVQDLGYWCQVAKDVLPTEDFKMVQEAYTYQDDEHS